MASLYVIAWWTLLLCTCYVTIQEGQGGTLLHVSDSNATWAESLQECQNMGGKIADQTTQSLEHVIKSEIGEQEFWVGKYKILTPLIWISGCFGFDSTAKFDNTFHISANEPLAECQTLCGNESFGIRDWICYCIGEPKVLIRAPPSRCSQPCHPRGDLQTLKCGGADGLSVYRTVEEDDVMLFEGQLDEEGCGYIGKPKDNNSAFRWYIGSCRDNKQGYICQFDDAYCSYLNETSPCNILYENGLRWSNAHAECFSKNGILAPFTKTSPPVFGINDLPYLWIGMFRKMAKLWYTGGEVPLAEKCYAMANIAGYSRLTSLAESCDKRYRYVCEIAAQTTTVEFEGSGDISTSATPSEDVTTDWSATDPEGDDNNQNIPDLEMATSGTFTVADDNAISNQTCNNTGTVDGADTGEANIPLPVSKDEAMITGIVILIIAVIGILILVIVCVVIAMRKRKSVNLQKRTYNNKTYESVTVADEIIVIEPTVCSGNVAVVEPQPHAETPPVTAHVTQSPGPKPHAETPPVTAHVTQSPGPTPSKPQRKRRPYQRHQSVPAYVNVSISPTGTPNLRRTRSAELDIPYIDATLTSLDTAEIKREWKSSQAHTSETSATGTGNPGTGSQSDLEGTGSQRHASTSTTGSESSCDVFEEGAGDKPAQNVLERESSKSSDYSSGKDVIVTDLDDPGIEI